MVLAGAATAACAGPAHLGSGTTGEPVRAIQAAQAVRDPSKPPATAALTGLDSQEATIISGGYRVSLAPKGAPPEEASMLYVAPQQQSSDRVMPPPSVPQNGK